MANQSQQSMDEAAQLAQGYPALAKVLAALNSDEELPETGIRRVEINCFASGEATYRVWRVDAEEPAGGYLESV